MQKIPFPMCCSLSGICVCVVEGSVCFGFFFFFVSAQMCVQVAFLHI